MAAIQMAKFAEYIVKVMPTMLEIKTLNEVLNSTYQVSGIN
jgi:hypothetical protein